MVVFHDQMMLVIIFVVVVSVMTLRYLTLILFQLGIKRLQFFVLKYLNRRSRSHWIVIGQFRL